MIRTRDCIALLLAAAGILSAQETAPPAEPTAAPPAAATAAAVPATTAVTVPVPTPVTAASEAPAVAAPETAPAPAEAPAEAPVTTAPEAATAGTPTANAPTAAPEGATPGAPGPLQLNFSNAPVETVLDYLSRAAGFVIVRDTPVTGTVSVVSHHPLSPDEAVSLLHTLLNDKGLAVIREDRVLRVVRRDDARMRDIPVVSGNDPQTVPRSSEVITQIVSLRHTRAVKLIETLKPLLPTQTTLTANDDSNSLLVTDTRTNIRRMLEIVQILDSVVASILEIQVIPLQYADAVETADVINKVYETPVSRSSSSSSSSRGSRGDFFARMRGFGPGGPGDMGGGDMGGQDNSGEARQTASYVKAVADQHGNAVVVTAPAELLPQITQLVKELDAPTDAVTTLRVFPLRFADAATMATAIATLYPTTGTGSRFSRTSGRGFFGGPPGAQAGATSAASQSARKLSESQVVAVADTRTNSVIVSASIDTIEDIAAVIAELDAGPTNVPTVHVYQLEHGDVQRAKEIIDSMFDDLGATGGAGARSNRGTNTSTRRNTGTGTTRRNTGTSSRNTGTTRR